MSLEWAGPVLGACVASAVALGVALRQRADRRRDLATQRKRDVLRPDHDAARALLDATDKLAYQVKQRAPLTLADLKTLDADQLRMDLELATQRAVPELRPSLAKCAELVAVVLNCAGQSEQEALTARAQQRLAIRQDRAATELKQTVTTGRAALTAWWEGIG
jgi:hypothetical protein